MEKKILGPRVFISYSWDSEAHKEKVANFVQGLRSSDIDVVYDKDLQLGERLQYFMESIPKSDIVLFICTPNYKYRADNRILGVGYENTLITSELYETYNERKFIPVLFAGTWETSLPIWAKGKLGIDLSSQESYETNYRDLISYLQNYVLNESIESTVKHGEEQTIPENHLDISNVKSKITKIWIYFSDITKFRGLVLVAVISGIILWVIQSYGSLLLPNFKNPTPNDSLIDNTTSNNIGTDDIEPNNTSPDDTALDDTTLYDIFPDDTYLNLIKSTSNGTMPKGTTPIIITITEETKEKLAFTQELFIGCSKKWIDDTLGPPFAERRLSTTDVILISPYEDESNKTGEILLCAYNISDIVIVQAYFDVSDNSCQAFFVTLLDDFSNVEIMLPKVYSSFVSDKPLGEFAFSEISEGLERIYGYSSTGNARTFYGEEYYFMAPGNYQDFYFAVLDYGMLNNLPDFIRFTSIIQFYIAPNNDTLSFLDTINDQRGKFYPNTYGISALNNRLTFDMFSNYLWFDTLPLRGWTYQ